MDHFTIDTKDYRRGRIAAQLDDPFDYNKSPAWRAGYRDEIINPTGGLTPQEGEKRLMIDFSKYISWFEDYCKEHNKVFSTQKEADEFYAIWIEGFNWASYVYY